MAPNSAKTTTKPIALVRVNTRLGNRRGGRIGSAARRSTTEQHEQHHGRHGQAEDETDAQAYMVPPRVVRSTMQVSRASHQRAQVVDPMLDALSQRGQDAATTPSATTPMGRFT